MPLRRAIQGSRAANRGSNRGLSDEQVDSYSPDAYGGTGKRFDWEVIKETGSVKRIILAGGLNAENVGNAINTVRPYGVDVSSGVEIRPGVKDPVKVQDFFRAVQQHSS